MATSWEKQGGKREPVLSGGPKHQVGPLEAAQITLYSTTWWAGLEGIEVGGQGEQGSGTIGETE